MDLLYGQEGSKPPGNTGNGTIGTPGGLQQSFVRLSVLMAIDEFEVPLNAF